MKTKNPKKLKKSKNQKDHKLEKLTAIALFIAVAGLVILSGTYAKYTSTASGSDTATVAKWIIKAGAKNNEQLITGSGATVAFNLFDTILDEDGENVETDVTESKIAPGTSGKFELSVKNESEVNAKYGVSFTVSGATVPFEFKVNDGSWTNSLTSVSETTLNMNSSDIITVYWKWPYEVADDTQTSGTNEATQRDTLDTGLGIDANSTTQGAGVVSVTATLTVTQVD